MKKALNVKNMILKTYLERDFKEIELLPLFSGVGVKASREFVENLEKLWIENPNFHIRYCEKEEKEMIFMKNGNEVITYDYDKLLVHWTGYLITLLKQTGDKAFFNQKKLRVKSHYDFIKELLENEEAE